MQRWQAGWTLLFTLLLSACHDDRVALTAASCQIEAPRELMPNQVAEVRLGMSFNQVSRLLGTPGYSPVAGQHYFFTGGMCPMALGANFMAACGVVAEFRRFEYGGSPKNTVTNALQSCSWGAIGE